MNNTLHGEKLTQAFALLRELNWDAWLILTSDASDPCLPLIPGVATVGNGAFLFTKAGQAHAFASRIDAQEIEESGLFDRVHKYDQALDRDLLCVLADLRPSVLALNYSKEDNLCDGLTVGRYFHFQKLTADLPPFQTVSSQPLLSRLRSIKSETEIALLKEAIRITLLIYDEVASQMQIGMTEKEIGQLFVQGLSRHNVVNGLDRKLSPPMVLKDNIAHRPPGDLVVEAGDLLIVDFSVDFQGYVSDIARTFYFLRPGEKAAPQVYQAAFQAVFDAISAAAAALRPGVQGVQVDRVARDLLCARGYPEISHATGHQIGQYTHDGGALLGPAWERYGNQPFQPLAANMVFTLEPTILPAEPPFILSEENVRIREDGVEFLSRRQTGLVLIPPTREGQK